MNKGTLQKRNGFYFQIALVILLVAIGAYYVGKSNQNTLESEKSMQRSTSGNPEISQSIEQISPTIDPLASWKTYINTPYGYLVQYPTTVTLYEDNTYYHYLEFKRVGAPQGEFPVFYAAAIKDTFVAKSPASVNYMSSDVIASLFNLKVGETKTVDTSTMTRTTDRKIGGENALALKVKATGIDQNRFYVKHGGNIYMFVSDYAPTEDFQNFLSSVKFTK